MKTNNAKTDNMANNTENAKVICYLRSSTDKQEIETQKAELYKSIHADGYDDDRIIEIGKAGISACNLKDEYFQLFDDMERLIEGGDIKCVYVYSMTRLVRMDDTRFVSFCKFLTDHRVNLKLKDSGMTLLNADGSYNFGMEVAIKITALVTKQMTKELKMQLQRGKERNKAQGKWNGGKVFFGYKVTEDGNIDTDDTNASIVRHVYESFLNGTSGRQIARDLYNKGIINHRAEKSREIFVYKILKSPAYKGTANENGVTIYKRLVSDKEFAQAQAMLKDGQKAPRKVYAPVVSYGLGLLRCANEQAKNGFYLMQPHRADNQYWEYNSKFCINADLTDSLLLQVTNKYITEFSGLDTQTKLDEMEARHGELQTMARTAVERKNKAQEAIDRIEKRLAAGKISEEKADLMRRPYDEEYRREGKAAEDYLQQAGALLHQTLKIANGTIFDMYKLGDDSRQAEIQKYVDYVEVSRVKNGTYNYDIHFKLTDRVERWQIRSKAHEYKRWNGEDWESVELRMLDRYTDRRKADREKRKASKKAA